MRALILSALAMLVAACGCRQTVAESETADGPAVTVRVETAQRRSLDRTFAALGRTEPLLNHMASLAPAVEGQVDEIRVKPGDTVKAGQPIVVLDQAIARADLAEKIAARKSLEASLRLLISKPRPEEQKIDELAIELANVAAARAQAVVDSLQPLRQHNEVSQHQLIDTEQAAQQARVQREAAEAQLQLHSAAPRAEAIDEAKVHVAQADEAVHLSQAHLELLAIRAPIDGVVEQLNCHPGQTIAIGAPIGEIVDTNELYVLAWLPAASAKRVRVGQTFHVVSQHPSADSTRPEEQRAAAEKDMAPSGKIVFVGNVVDPQTGNIAVRGLVANLAGKLAAGEVVDLNITVESHPDVLCVPVNGVFDLGEGPLIAVVRDGKSAILHPQLGVTQQGWVAVSNTDLADGEPVIVDGGFNLPEGTPVKTVGATHSLSTE